MTCTCTHKGPIVHYKAYTDMLWQWEQYQVPTTKLLPSFGAISPIVDLHGQQRHSGKAGQSTLASEGSEDA